MRELRERGGNLPAAFDVSPAVFEDEEARKLTDCLAVFPGEMEIASRDLAPHAITTYASSLAGRFHAFYNANRILGEAAPIEAGRLLLTEAARVVLARCLTLLGVSAPERM